jgi:hypothetical protein
MRHQRPLTLLAVCALAGGLSACGSDDELSSPVPKTAPDLTIPTATTEARAGDEPAPSTTTSTTTTGTTSATAPPAAATPPAAQPPAAAAPPAAPTGGQAPPTGQSTTGGAQANGGEFDEFCEQNPGARC